jgi:hypothetical protein
VLISVGMERWNAAMDNRPRLIDLTERLNRSSMAPGRDERCVITNLSDTMIDCRAVCKIIADLNALGLICVVVISSIVS